MIPELAAQVAEALADLKQGKAVYVGSMLLAKWIEAKAAFPVERSLWEDGFWKLERR